MRYDRGDWEIVEAYSGDKALISSALEEEAPSDLVRVFSQLRILLTGIPPDPEKGVLHYQVVGKVDASGWPSAMPVYVLKTTPAHWRIYFVALQSRRQIILLHAVKKKRNDRDPKDLDRCITVLERLAAGRAQVDAIPIPPAT